VPGFGVAPGLGVGVGRVTRVDRGVGTGVTGTAVGTICSYRTPGERSAGAAGVVTTGIDTTVGVGIGVDGMTWGARVAGGRGGSTGAGTKTSVGLAAGVTIRATVCFVELQVGNVASTAPAAASARIEDQRRGRFIGGSVVVLGVYPENREREKKALRPHRLEAPRKRSAPRKAPEIAA
jgi:hypothetical protein